MRKNIFAVIFFVLAICVKNNAQKIATLEVDLTKSTNGINVPVSTDLDAITFLPDSVLNLVELQGNKRVPVAFQVSQGKQRTLNWVIKPGKNRAEKKIFELIKGKPSVFPPIKATMDSGELTIHDGARNLLRYIYKTVYPPAGIDTAFKRSAFIHPLWTPHGQVLTRIQAPDHYHHYGLWDPWTHVLFEGDTLDFWNLKERKGTVRFGNFVSVTNGDVYAEFQALHQHVAFKTNGTEKVALNELQTVRVYKPGSNDDYYIADITIEMNCASESPFLILEYRYAGLGWRATEKWNKDNSEVITSEGKNRKEAEGSTARLCIIQGALDNDYGGAVMMSYPSNYNHPEPMRVWPEDSNKVGELFAMFAPTKNKNWLLMPGKTYTLKYRFVVFNGHFNKEKAESAWQYYSRPARVTVK
jgi:hypothetical protein